MSARKIIPLLDRVLIQRVKAAERTAAGLYIPEAAQEQLNEGNVLAVGPGIPNKDGKPQPLSLKVGDRVLLPPFGGNTVKLGQEEFLLYKDSEILAKLPDVSCEQNANGTSFTTTMFENEDDDQATVYGEINNLFNYTERQFFHNFLCGNCALQIDTLHALMQHREFCQTTPTYQNPPQFITTTFSYQNDSCGSALDGKVGFAGVNPNTLFPLQIPTANNVETSEEQDSMNEDDIMSESDQETDVDSYESSPNLSCQEANTVPAIDSPLFPSPQIDSKTLKSLPIFNVRVGNDPRLRALRKIARHNSPYYQYDLDTGKRKYVCVVPSCNREYKNANGLKYHLQHGHKVESEQDVDLVHASQIAADHLRHLIGRRGPESMRPFKCTVAGCGKSYKNLNGHKYHMEHSHKNQK
ncbi:10 kDa heat shock protein [Nowakowskiella sp. JEL0407]|nr:10 kDa heat shock protein [Nowakowskiella sp. JEL0407]